jgi:tetratricopeptide (TPR) repeat protein
MRFRRKPKERDQLVEQFLKTHIQRAGQFIRRNRAATAAGGLLLLILLAGTIAGVWQAHRGKSLSANAAHPSNNLRGATPSRLTNYYDPLNDFAGATRIHEGGLKVASPPEVRRDYGNVQNDLGAANEEYRPAALENPSTTSPTNERLADNSRNRTYIQPFPITYPYPGGVSILTSVDPATLGPNAADYLIMINKPQLALAAFQKRLQNDEQAVAANPNNVQVQTDLAYSSSRIGDLLLAMNDQAGALPYLQQAVDIYTKTANSATGTPDDPTSALQLSQLIGKLAKLHATLGYTEKAIAECNKAAGILNQVAVDTTDVEQRHIRASAYEEIGDAYFFLAGDARTPQALTKNLWAAAQDAYQSSLAILEALADQGLTTVDELAAIDNISHEIAETELFLAK